MDDRRYQISYLFKKRKLERSVKMNKLQIIEHEGIRVLTTHQLA